MGEVSVTSSGCCNKQFCLELAPGWPTVVRTTRGASFLSWPLQVCAVNNYRHTPPQNVIPVNVFPVNASWFLMSKIHWTYVSVNTTLSVHFYRNIYIKVLGGSIHTVQENAEAAVVATKEIGLEVNADKTKYMVMSREQTAGLSHTMKADNSSIERMEEFEYLWTTLTNQNSIQKEIKSRLKLGNACYHSVQKLLSSSLISKNLKIKIYRTIILPVVL